MAKSIVEETAAASNKTEPAAPPANSGIEYVASPWSWVYTGQRDALMAAGLVPDGVPFPGDRPGRPRCGFVTPEGRKVSISKSVKGRFRVTVFPNGEDDERREARAALAKAEAEANTVEAKIRAEQASRPATHQDFRDGAANHLWRALAAYRVIYHLDNNESGYSFSAQTVDEFDGLAAALYWLIKQGETTFDARRRDRRIIEAKLKAARLDVSLQRVLNHAAAN